MWCDDSSTRNNCAGNLENGKICTFHFFFSILIKQRIFILLLWDFIYLLYLCICVDMVNVSGYQSWFQLKRYGIKFFLFLSASTKDWAVRKSRWREKEYISWCWQSCWMLVENSLYMVSWNLFNWTICRQFCQFERLALCNQVIRQQEIYLYYSLLWGRGFDSHRRLNVSIIRRLVSKCEIFAKYSQI